MDSWSSNEYSLARNRSSCDAVTALTWGQFRRNWVVSPHAKQGSGTNALVNSVETPYTEPDATPFPTPEVFPKYPFGRKRPLPPPFGSTHCVEKRFPTLSLTLLLDDRFFCRALPSALRIFVSYSLSLATGFVSYCLIVSHPPYEVSAILIGLFLLCSFSVNSCNCSL